VSIWYSNMNGHASNDNVCSSFCKFSSTWRW